MKYSTLYPVLLLIIAACLSIWLPVPWPLRLASATLLAFFLPGWVLLRLIGLKSDDWPEQAALAAGLSYGLTSLGSLGLLYASGHLTTLSITAVLTVMTLGLSLACLRRSTPALPTGGAGYPPLTRLDLLYFLLPVAVAVFFSFTNLAYADYWGDEMNGLLRAISIIEGRPETLFEHTKGPVEVLLPALFGLLVGRFEPFSLRFPFALAQVVGITAYYLLARRMFNRNVGLLAALILAINGLYLTFGRIIQYQAVLFLMTGLSLLLAYRFYQKGTGLSLALSSFMVGVGLLAHYDMLLVLPPLGYLVWRGYTRPGPARRQNWLWPITAVLILLAVTASFYLPFLLNPHLAKTSSYLGRVIGAADWPRNNFDELYIFAVMYNSRYYVLFIALLGLGLIAVQLANRFRRPPDRRLWFALAATLLLTLLALILGWTSFIPVLVSILVFALLGFSAGAVELEMIYVWVGVSFIGYVFFIDRPRTHLQIIYPGWSLLAALALTGLASKIQAKLAGLPRRRLTAGLVTILGLLLGFFAFYQYLLFVDARREYIFTYPAHKVSLYWEDPHFPFGSRRLYGAPHRLGWQMIHQLYAQAELQGDWDSNDDGSNLFWYTLGAQRNPCYPRYYFLTQFEQREESERPPSSFNLEDYVRIGQVWNWDRLQIDLYEFAPLGRAGEPAMWREPPRYDSFIVPADFQSLPFTETDPDIGQPLARPALFRPSPAALEQIANQYNDPRIVKVRDTVTLLGYDLDDSRARPGGLAVLTLYWQAVEVVNLPYKIFTHLESEPAAGSARLWAQADDFPACGSRPTQRWPVGQTIMDRHLLRLPADIPPADYLIQVGLYEPQTGLRMDLLDVMNNPQGNSYGLTHLTVRSGS